MDHRKYLRVRGEEDGDVFPFTVSLEIPPRARRRGRRTPMTKTIEGNTSACAEKRSFVGRILGCPGKYLRVRGEELSKQFSPIFTVEIPPRARRRGRWQESEAVQEGNTSACAEKS